MGNGPSRHGGDTVKRHRDADDNVRQLPLISDEQIRRRSDIDAKQALFKEITQMTYNTGEAHSDRSRTHVPRRALAIAAGVLALAALVVPVALDGDGNAAYAVTTQDDGTVRVEINDFRDPEGLQHRLSQEGIPVHIDQVPAGWTCTRHDLREGPPLDEERMSDGTIVFVLDPADYRDGSTLLIQAEDGDGELEFLTAVGPLEDCEPVRNERIDLGTPSSSMNGGGGDHDDS